MADVRAAFTRMLRAELLGLAFALVGSAVVLAQEPLPSQELPPPSAAPANSEELVVDVRVDGNKAVPLHKIAPNIQTRAGRPYSPELVEEDVRRILKTRQFVNVTTSYQRVPEGVVVIFQVIERPTLTYVKYVGASLRRSTLDKQSGIKVSDSIDPYMVDEARRKLEEYYQSKGFSKARVVTAEGNKPGDRGAVFVITEGPKLKIYNVEFEGNTIAEDGRLKTQISSKPPILYLFKGEVDYEKIDEDVNKLTAYYRSLGYFSAKVGREVEFGEDSRWATLRFVINEGPRYKVRNVSVVGAKQFTTSELEAELKLKGGQFFEQGAMNKDISTLQDRYGAIGYVFCNVTADNRFLEEPGELDLVYQVEEGDRYRVGRVQVRIEGEDPHTRINTVLNRVDLHPGDIVDIRKIRDSERRLKASGLFKNDPATGVTPKITFETPEGEEVLAARNGDGFRGQSPDNSPPPVVYTSPRYEGGDKVIDVTVDGAIAPGDTAEQVTPPAAVAPTPDSSSHRGNPFWSPGGRRTRFNYGYQNSFASTPEQGTQSFGAVYPPSTGEPIVLSEAAAAGSIWETAPPTMGFAPQEQLIVRGQSPQQAPSGYNSAPSDQFGQVQMGSLKPQGSTSSYAGSGGVTPVQYTAPVAPSPNYSSAPVYGQPSPYAAQPGVPSAPPVTGYGSGNDLFNQSPAPFANEPATRDLTIIPQVAEAQTGRFMLGVGVNSNAGVLGSIVLDEQNADIFRLPTSWRDFIEGRAFRGAGQQVRLEAVPGSQVSRYTFLFRQPYLFDTRVSFSTSAYYFQRYYRDWFEERTGGRVGFGYQFPFVPDLSVSAAIRAEHVNIEQPTLPTPPQLAAALGGTDLFVGEFGIVHDTRDSTFIATEGHRIALNFDLGFGEYDFPRANIEARQHFLLGERPDGSGRQVLTLQSQLGFTGSQTPIFENYFAGGFSSMRGFNFRGVGPVVQNVNVGGQFQWLNTIEYMFSITADDMIRGVAFCDFGTVEENIELNADNFRVAPGLGLRITVPALGPAPIAIDFSAPILHAPGDNLQNIAFYFGLGR